MMRNLWILISLLMSGGWLLTACGSQNGVIVDAFMAGDLEGREIVDTYGPADTFYSIIQLSEETAADAVVRVVWLREVEAEAVESCYQTTRPEAKGASDDETEPCYEEIRQDEEPAGERKRLGFKFNNRSNETWPAGHYQVDLYVNDELAQSIPFSVRAGTAEAISSQPTPTPTQPTPTRTPIPTITPIPTSATAQDSGAGAVTLESRKFAQAAIPEAMYDDPYRHDSGAFTVGQPVNWEIREEDQSSVLFGDGKLNESYVGVLFQNVEQEYDKERMNEFSAQAVDFIAAQYADEYEILEQDAQKISGRQLHYVAVQYEAPGGGGDMDFLFEQVDEVVFMIYLITPDYQGVQSTWSEIRTAYRIDADLAGEALTTLDFVAIWPKPTPTPEPVASCPRTPLTGTCIQPPPGQAAFYVVNGTDLDITVGGDGPLGDSRIAPAGSDIVIYLPPGRYQYYLNQVGGNRQGRGQVDLAAGEIKGTSLGYDVNE